MEKSSVLKGVLGLALAIAVVACLLRQAPSTEHDGRFPPARQLSEGRELASKGGARLFRIERESAQADSMGAKESTALPHGDASIKRTNEVAGLASSPTRNQPSSGIRAALADYQRSRENVLTHLGLTEDQLSAVRRLDHSIENKMDEFSRIHAAPGTIASANADYLVQLREILGERTYQVYRDRISVAKERLAQDFLAHRRAVK